MYSFRMDIIVQQDADDRLIGQQAKIDELYGDIRAMESSINQRPQFWMSIFWSQIVTM